MVKNLSINFNGTIKISKPAIHRLLHDLQTELGLNISSLIINFVTNNALLGLNIEYLGHNYPTDIITFDYSGSPQSIDGELYISYKEAEHNAAKYRVKLSDEFTRLIIHGILHLVGYNDKKKGDKLKMKRLENKLVKKYKYHLAV